MTLRAVDVIALWLAMAAFAIALPVVAADDEGEETGSQEAVHESLDDARGGWAPTLALISGVSAQPWRGLVASEICRGCPIPDPMMGEELLRGRITGSDNGVTPFFGVNLELMTPALPIPSSPRVFIGGDLSMTFGLERIIANEGDPSTLSSPLPPGSVAGYGEDVVVGQGSETIAELDRLVYGLHLGVAFPFELFDRQLMVKPSLAWTRYEVKVDGLVLDAECVPSFFGNTLCNNSGYQREIRLAGNASKAFDGLGPGLDVEMETGRMGPLGTSVFFGARLYYILGDREIAFESTPPPFTDPVGTNDSTRGQFRFEADEWLYRMSLGLRFQWLGFED